MLSELNNFGLHTCSTTREYQKFFQNSFLGLNCDKFLTGTHLSVAQRKKLMDRYLEVYLGSSQYVLVSITALYSRVLKSKSQSHPRFKLFV